MQKKLRKKYLIERLSSTYVDSFRAEVGNLRHMGHLWPKIYFLEAHSAKFAWTIIF